VGGSQKIEKKNSDIYGWHLITLSVEEDDADDVDEVDGCRKLPASMSPSSVVDIVVVVVVSRNVGLLRLLISIAAAVHCRFEASIRANRSD
jgi:hypothetical protein